MTNRLIAESGASIRVQGDFAQLLQQWRESFLSDPLIALREFISNAHDACLGIPKADIRIDVKADMIGITDNGKGMTKQTLLDEFANFHIKKSSNTNSARIGEFGLGRISAFALANRLEITTKHQSEPHGWRLVWIEGKPKMQLHPDSRQGLGTSVRLYVRTKFRHLAKPAILKAYIARVFALLPRSIYINGTNQSLNPNWQLIESSVRRSREPQKLLQSLVDDQAALPLLQTYYPQHKSIAAYLSHDTDTGRVLLSIPEIDEEPRLEQSHLFKRGVWVCEAQKPLLPTGFGFVRVLIDNPYFKLSATRQEVLADDRMIYELPQLLKRELFSFFTLLANAQPQRLQKILHSYREPLLKYAVEQLNWRMFLAKHYQMYSLEGFTTWQLLRQKLPDQHPSRLALVNSTAELTQHYETVLISKEDTERDFVRLLAMDSHIKVIEPDQNDPKEEENVALKLYCISLLNVVAKQLKILGAEDAPLAQLSWVCAQITPNTQPYE